MPNLETITKCGFSPKRGKRVTHAKTENPRRNEPYQGFSPVARGGGGRRVSATGLRVDSCISRP